MSLANTCHSCCVGWWQCNYYCTYRTWEVLDLLDAFTVHKTQNHSVSLSGNCDSPNWVLWRCCSNQRSRKSFAWPWRVLQWCWCIEQLVQKMKASKSNNVALLPSRLQSTVLPECGHFGWDRIWISLVSWVFSYLQSSLLCGSGGSYWSFLRHCTSDIGVTWSCCAVTEQSVYRPVAIHMLQVVLGLIDVHHKPNMYILPHWIMQITSENTYN